MQEIKVGDFVIVKDAGEVGVVTEKTENPLSYRVRARGTSSTYSPYDILGLTAAQVRILNQSLAAVASVIDTYREADVYDPVYDEEGKIVYSSAAATVFRVLSFAEMIVHLGNLSDRVAILEKELMEAQAQR